MQFFCLSVCMSIVYRAVGRTLCITNLSWVEEGIKMSIKIQCTVIYMKWLNPSNSRKSVESISHISKSEYLELEPVCFTPVQVQTWLSSSMHIRWYAITKSHRVPSKSSFASSFFDFHTCWVRVCTYDISVITGLRPMMACPQVKVLTHIVSFYKCSSQLQFHHYTLKQNQS